MTNHFRAIVIGTSRARPLRRVIAVELFKDFSPLASVGWYHVSCPFGTKGNRSHGTPPVWFSEMSFPASRKLYRVNRICSTSTYTISLPIPVKSYLSRNFTFVSWRSCFFLRNNLFNWRCWSQKVTRITLQQEICSVLLVLLPIWNVSCLEHYYD